MSNRLVMVQIINLNFVITGNRLVYDIDRMKKISGGVVHKLPFDLEKFLLTDPKMLTVWENITPLARNEWICWIESAKKQETRENRINDGRSKLLSGMRRPCCWAGCTHRK